LDDQRGTSDRAEIFLNVPVPKLRIEPNIIPSAEHFVDMLVIARQLLAQFRGFVNVANSDRASETKRFDKNVRRLQNEPAHALRPSAGVNQSDGSAIAMAEQDGMFDAELAQQIWKHDCCFVVHEINTPFLREALGSSMAIARIHQNPAASGLRHSLREILPHGDRAEAFVEHDNDGIRAGRRISQRFQALPVYSDVFEFVRCHGQTVPSQKHLENRFSTTQIWSMLIGISNVWSSIIGRKVEALRKRL